MRSLLPKIFRRRAKKDKGKNGVDSVHEKVISEGGKGEGKKGRKWGFGALKGEGKKSKQQQQSLKGVATVTPRRVKPVGGRRPRKPNMAMTQRKLAASQRRLRQLQQTANIKEQSLNHHNASRTTTHPPLEKSDSAASSHGRRPATDQMGDVNRIKTAPAFMMRSDRGDACIEVEFTDDGEDLATGCRKGTRFPISILAPGEARSENIKVVWKGPMPPKIHPTVEDDDLMSDYQSASSNSSVATTVRDDLKHTESAEWESVAESSEDTTEAWAEFHRKEMMTKLAGMHMQEPHKSQDYTTKRAMRILPYPPQKKSKIPLTIRTKIRCSDTEGLPRSVHERKMSCC